ncbi:polysaccharide deacetylase family protein [Hydrogenophaga sp.]|uniref:polysaccharide deacetylase family protein n=1 Tax=Hydrogenophaga sp. TaxID=1904254 RepID=UPI002FC6DC7C
MLDVFFTVDVEIWCEGWQDIDKQFPEAFRRYIEGPTSKGRYGLPYQIEVLNQHNLKGVFFIEPLFAMRCGQQALDDIVGLVRQGGQEVQLHLHTEWVNESREPLFEGYQPKRQYLRHYNLAEQTRLIAKGIEMLHKSGVQDINAFRAGNFAFDRNTLSALAANKIPFDSSYNASMFGSDSGFMPGVQLVEPIECEGVHEYPMTVFNDGTSTLRHTQLTACSSEELLSLLWQALEQRRNSFVILSHGFELLNKAKNSPDDVVVRRFHKLCAFLDRHRDSFRTCGFRGLTPTSVTAQPGPLKSPLSRTGARMMTQLYRNRYG